MDKLPPKFMQRVDAIIQSKMHSEAFGVNVLHKELSMSYSHMHRKIKEKTKVSPSIYIRNKRLARACYMLEMTDLNIGEISHKVGFNTPNYFSECFSDCYGRTPSAFRKEMEK